MYEGVIVDSVTEQNVKIREIDTQRDVYSWKAPYQEAILKSKNYQPSVMLVSIHLC